ncbi:MAG: hypothetical protein K0R27_2498 [Xanthobacteraceae bacterium]|nr:hypothetical protein [Xanthobacteraceae bacterium]
MKEWESDCIADFEQGMSYDDLARKYGNRHPTTIRKMLRVHGAIRKAAPVSKGGPKRLSDLKPLSKVHQAIGIEINRYRTLTHDLGMSEMGEKLNVNRALIRKMELGIHDFTLTEINMISELLGLPVMELLTPKTLAPRSLANSNGHSA